MDKVCRLGIIGPGKIAHVIVKALANIPQFSMYAVGSRNLENAVNFQKQYGFIKAYGSYQALVEDPMIDLVYIATPHAFHYEHMNLCIAHKKNIICEKAFCLTKAQAIDVFEKAKVASVFISEAMCPAYLPSRRLIEDLLHQKVIGDVISYHGVFGASLTHVPRVVEKGLGGGALYDIGIYPLYMCLSLFGFDPKIEYVEKQIYHEIDGVITAQLSYPNIKATFISTIFEDSGMYCDIVGTKGRIHIENIGRPTAVIIYNHQDVVIKKYENLRQTSGYEYEFLASYDAILKDKLETKEMSWQNTIDLLDYIERILLF